MEPRVSSGLGKGGKGQTRRRWRKCGGLHARFKNLRGRFSILDFSARRCSFRAATTSFILKCLGISVVSSIIAALCGVGGGVVIGPGFVLLLGLPQKTAVATSLAIIIPALMATT